MPGDKLSEDELSQGRIQWGHESLFPLVRAPHTAGEPVRQPVHELADNV